MPIGIGAAMLGSAAIGAAGSIASTALGGEGGAAQTPGFHTSGNVGAKDGFTERPALPEPLYKGEPPKNKSILSRTNNFLGSEVGHIAKGVGGSLLGDFRQRRNSRNRFKDLKDEGLTAQEIAGSSGGGSVQAQGNTLGSGPQVQAASQQNFVAAENQKQRDHEIQKTKIQQEVPQRQVKVSETMAYWQQEKIAVEIMQTMKQMDKVDFDMRVHFPTKFASMAPENMLASVIAAKTGVDMTALLGGMAVTPEQSKAMNEMFELTQTVLARSRREFRGTFDLIKEISAYIFDNSPSLMGPLQKLKGVMPELPLFKNGKRNN